MAIQTEVQRSDLNQTWVCYLNGVEDVYLEITRSSWCLKSLYEMRFPRSLVPSLFGPRDQVHGRWIFHRPRVGVLACSYFSIISSPHLHPHYTVILLPPVFLQHQGVSFYPWIDSPVPTLSLDFIICSWIFPYSAPPTCRSPTMLLSWISSTTCTVAKPWGWDILFSNFSCSK